MPKEYLDLLEKFKWQISFVLVGLSLVAAGILLTSGIFQKGDELETLDASSQSLVTNHNDEIVVDVSGAVVNPNVYKLPPDSRVEDALAAAGGLTNDADQNFLEKVLNRASPIADGQKIYIPSVDEQSNILSANSVAGGSASDNNESYLNNSSQNLININTASQKELESLSGIGPVFAQNIIEHRPYSSIEELLSRKVLRSDIYEKNKSKLTIY